MTVTLTPRFVGLIVIASLAAGWMGSSLTQTPASTQTQAGGTLRPLGGPPVLPRAETLRQRTVDPPMPSRGRNPFVFSSRAARSTNYRGPERRTEDVPNVAIPMPAAPIAPPMPVFKLTGVAANLVDGVAVFTAILNDNGAMVFAKSGDKLSRGYSVVRVEEMSVTLLDAEGVTQTIRLP
ncbi:MAG TPA: hypothetical protein VF491_20735 [Vicinamibacterales bacterium]|jgi:hypothetical protein